MATSAGYFNPLLIKSLWHRHGLRPPQGEINEMLQRHYDNAEEALGALTAHYDRYFRPSTAQVAQWLRNQVENMEAPSKPEVWMQEWFADDCREGQNAEIAQRALAAYKEANQDFTNVNVNHYVKAHVKIETLDAAGGKSADERSFEHASSLFKHFAVDRWTEELNYEGDSRTVPVQPFEHFRDGTYLKGNEAGARDGTALFICQNVHPTLTTMYLEASPRARTAMLSQMSTGDFTYRGEAGTCTVLGFKGEWPPDGGRMSQKGWNLLEAIAAQARIAAEETMTFGAEKSALTPFKKVADAAAPYTHKGKVANIQLSSAPARVSKPAATMPTPGGEPPAETGTSGFGVGWLFGIGFLVVGIGLISGRR